MCPESRSLTEDLQSRVVIDQIYKTLSHSGKAINLMLLFLGRDVRDHSQMTSEERGKKDLLTK